ncbi:hypothetical protein [Bacterioplanoides sp.]|uniref:hypothetical protein n=1 Tax=Bacterioplanoides sp. TaxID=2066072 RepID=UPI003B5BFBFD
MKKFSLFILTIIFSNACFSEVTSENLVAAIRSLCLAGDEYQIKIEGDASLSIMKKGAEGELTFSKRNINGITDIKQDDLKLKELDSIRKCIEPHVDKILNLMIEEATLSNKKTLNTKIKSASYLSRLFISDRNSVFIPDLELIQALSEVGFESLGDVFTKDDLEKIRSTYKKTQRTSVKAGMFEYLEIMNGAIHSNKCENSLLEGTPVEIIEDERGVPYEKSRIRVLHGACKDKTGWVPTASLRYEQS